MKKIKLPRKAKKKYVKTYGTSMYLSMINAPKSFDIVYMDIYLKKLVFIV